MGTWSEESFGNDTAADWVADYLDDPNIDKINEAISAVLEEDDYLDSDIACECIAACEVLARLKGNFGMKDSYSEDLDNWVKNAKVMIGKDTLASAGKALDLIVKDDSELFELWSDSDDLESWIGKMKDLKKRVIS